MNRPTMRQIVTEGLSKTPLFTAKVVRDSYTVIRRRFFKIVFIGFAVLVLGILLVLNLYFRQSRLNDIALEAFADIFDTELVDVSFDDDKTAYTFPELNGTGQIEFFDLRVRSVSDQYDFIHVPRVVLHYSLFGLPDALLSRVEVPDGLYLVFNRDEEGRWIDEDAFKAPEEEEEESSHIPEVIIRNAFIRLRDPTLFAELPPQVTDALNDEYPSFSYEGDRGQFISNIDVSLIRNPFEENQLILRGQCNCRLWGNATFVGSLSDGGEVDVQAIKLNQPLNHAFADRFARPIANIFDSVLADVEGKTNEADLRASIRTNDDKVDIRVEAGISASILSNVMPIVCTDLRANVLFDGENLYIRDSTARRGAGRITVNGSVEQIGSGRESVDVRVNVEGIAVDQALRDALTGIELGGERLYPEWELYKRANVEVKPEVPPAIPRLLNSFEPSGILNLEFGLRSHQVERDGELQSAEDVNFKLMVLDATVAYLGSEEALASGIASGLKPTSMSSLAAPRSTNRLEGQLPEQAEQPAEVIRGIPLPLYNVAGVIESLEESQEQTVVRIRGLNVGERDEVFKSMELELDASPRGLVAHRADGLGRMYLDGRIRSSKSETQDDSEIRLELSTDGMRLDEDLISYLPAGVQDLLEPYQPRGSLDVRSSEVYVSAVQTSAQFQLFAERLNAQFRYGDAARPFEAQDMRGALRFDTAGNVSIDSLRGKVGDSPVEVSFKIDDERPKDRMQYRADIRGLKLDQTLFEFLPSELSNIRDLFVDDDGLLLNGIIDVEVRGIDESQIDLSQIEITLNIREATMGLAMLAPLVLEEVQAQVRITFDSQGIQATVTSLSGRPRGDPDMTMVSVEGSVVIPYGQEDIYYNLNIDADNFHLTEHVRQAVDALLGGKPEEPSTLASIWEQMQIEPGASLGVVDIRANLSGALRDEPGLESNDQYWLDVVLKDCTLSYREFALPLKQVSGQVRIAKGPDGPMISFSGFRAQAPNGTVEISNLMFDRSSDDASFSITIAARDIPLNDDLRNAFPAAFRDVYDNLDPTAPFRGRRDMPERSGKMNANIMLTIGEDRLNYRAEMEFVEADLELGITFNHCSGTFSCRGALWGKQEGGEYAHHMLYDGRVHFSEARWKNLILADIRSSVQFADGRFILPNVRGDVHGGIIEGSMWVNFEGGETNYSGTFVARRISLGSVSTAMAGTQDPNAEDTLKGGMDAEITFHPLNDKGEIGKGRLDIGRIPLDDDELGMLESMSESEQAGKKAEIGKVPLFSGLYDALDVGESGYFDEAHIIFRLMEDRMKIRQMALISDFLRVEATGGINVANDDRNPYASAPSLFAADIESDTNYILYSEDELGDQFNLTLIPTFAPRLPTMPVLQFVIDAFKGVVAKIYIGGTPANPRVGFGSRARAANEEDLADVDPERTTLD